MRLAKGSKRVNRINRQRNAIRYLLRFVTAKYFSNVRVRSIKIMQKNKNNSNSELPSTRDMKIKVQLTFENNSLPKSSCSTLLTISDSTLQLVEMCLIEKKLAANRRK